MPGSKIQFTGINRTVSDFSNAGSCEELINLRPTDKGLIPVKDFQLMFGGRPYSDVWVHRIGTVTNYIAKEVYQGGIRVYEVDADGEPVGAPLAVLAGVGPEDVRFAALGNKIVISCPPLLQQRVFQYKEGSYVAVTCDAEMLSDNIATTVMEEHIATYETPVSLRDMTSQSMADAINDGFNILESANPEVAFGRFLLAFCFRTADGEEFWTFKWMATDIHAPAITTDSVADANFNYDTGGVWYDVVNQRVRCLEVRVEEGTGTVRLGGCRYSVTLGQINTAVFDKDTSLISEVCVYASRPERYVDTGSPSDIEVFSGLDVAGDYYICSLPLRSDMKYAPGKQLLYLQARVPVSSLLGGPRTVALRFGGSAQTTERTMNVDSGMTTRFGDMLSYNDRLHLFGSVAKTVVPHPECVGNVPPTIYDVFVRISSPDGGSRLIRRGTSALKMSNLILYPDARVKTIYLRRTGSTDILQFDMRPSDRYNFSYAIVAPGFFSSTSGQSLNAELDAAPTVSYFSTGEELAINVSERDNPFVYDVAHSYKIPAKILYVVPQQEAISDYKAGESPLAVFTSIGVFLLFHGDGDVLYSNISPQVGGFVATSKPAPTDSGVFFLAQGGLYLLSGRKAVLVSEALHEGPHTYIRQCAGYRDLSYAKALYDIRQHESQVPFDEFTSDAVLSFNRYRAELIVSSPRYRYSYVLSLKHHQWFKITHRFAQSEIGADIITSLVGTDAGSLGTCTLDCSGAVPDDPSDNATRLVRLVVTKDSGETFYVEQEFTPGESGPGPDTSVPVTGIVVTPAHVTVERGKTVQLSAIISPADASNKAVVWSSSSQSIATVNGAGVVRGISEGSCIITAMSEDGGHAASCTIEVTATDIMPYFSASSYNLVAGETAVIVLSNPSAHVLSFSVNSIGPASIKFMDNSETVTTFPSDGRNATIIRFRVTGVSAGSVTLNAREGSVTVASCTISVAESGGTVPVNGVSVTPAILSLVEGETGMLVAAVSPSGASDKSVSWSTSKSSVATVDNGLVTAVGPGTCVITATSNSDPTKKDTCSVTVTETVPEDDLAVSPSSLSFPAAGGVMDIQVTTENGWTIS